MMETDLDTKMIQEKDHVPTDGTGNGPMLPTELRGVMAIATQIILLLLFFPRRKSLLIETSLVYQG